MIWFLFTVDIYFYANIILIFFIYFLFNIYLLKVILHHKFVVSFFMKLRRCVQSRILQIGFLEKL